MIKRKRLGQHFLNSDSIAQSIVLNAEITSNDTVFEIGTGLGILTPLLCNQARKVISVDVDEDLASSARSKFSSLDNLVIMCGDGFKQRDTFSIFVSNLPYSKSKDAVEWLAQSSFSHGVVMVQKEFAEKLLAKSPKKRKAVSVIANHAFEIISLFDVKKDNFSPPPKVDSVVLKIVKKNSLTKELIQIINKIFSYRRKTVKNILKQFNKDTDESKRVDDLSGDEIINLARKIIEK